MEVVELDRGNGTTCKIHLFGATLTSWTVNNQELIFVSKNAVFDNKKAIRGGIPFCFPVFGPWKTGLPQHGFARTSEWTLTTAPVITASGDVTATLTLSDNEKTREVWDDNRFLLTYTLTLTEDKLEMVVGLENKNLEKGLQFTMALHTYIKVKHVEEAVVLGLEGKKYRDKTLEGVPTVQEDRERVNVAGWTDRVYMNTDREQVVEGVAEGGKLVLEKEGLEDTVVWNPWLENAAKMGDLGEDQWQGFLCVEVGQCSQPVKVEAGEVWSARHSLQYVPV